MRIVISIIISGLTILALRLFYPAIVTHPDWNLISTAIFIAVMLAMYFLLGFVEKRREMRQ